ncbi:MAG TPA: hypothetical protein VKG24_10505, partial [Pseudolabrys sp.]|nr:hypothetical protein [Pseudolabrys sp.]
MQDVADPPCHLLLVAEGNESVLHGDCRQIKVLPTTFFKDVTGKVVLMQALHNDDNRAVILVIKARHQRAAVPIDHAFAGHLRERLLSLERVVDDDEVGA